MQDDIPPKDFEQTICFCHNVSCGQIKEVMRDGALTIEKIQELTQASTGCGGCLLEVEQILAEWKSS